MGEPFITVPIASIRPETPTLVRLSLDLRGSPLMGQYTVPGQYVRMFVGEQTPNYFSIASAPEDRRHLEFLIRTKGDPALALAASRAGDPVQVSPVAGRGFPVDEGRGGDLALFAAGSGIAPIRAVIGHVLADRRAFGHVTLCYGVRDRQELAFGDEIDAWRAAGIETWVTLSRPTEDWVGLRGYVQDSLDHALPPGAWPRSPEPADLPTAFVCGFEEMVEAITAGLEVRGVPPSRIFKNF